MKKTLLIIALVISILMIGFVFYGIFMLKDMPALTVGGCAGVYKDYQPQCCENWARENGILHSQCVGNWAFDYDLNQCKWVCAIG